MPLFLDATSLRRLVQARPIPLGGALAAQRATHETHFRASRSSTALSRLLARALSGLISDWGTNAMDHLVARADSCRGPRRSTKAGSAMLEATQPVLTDKRTTPLHATPRLSHRCAATFSQYDDLAFTDGTRARSGPGASQPRHRGRSSAAPCAKFIVDAKRPKLSRF